MRLTFRPNWTDWHVVQEVRTGRYIVMRHVRVGRQDRDEDEEFAIGDFLFGDMAQAHADALNRATPYAPLQS